MGKKRSAFSPFLGIVSVGAITYFCFQKKDFSHFFTVGKAGREPAFRYTARRVIFVETRCKGVCMQRLGKYVKTDRMCDLVSDHYRVLLVMSRFGIGLGFGDKTIDEVCRANGVDTFTFLVVVNMLLSDEVPQPVSDKVYVDSLLRYLHNSHDYFLEFRLPEIRRKLVDVVGQADELSRAIIAYFDGYIDGVNAHMAYEEEIVFPYVRGLLEGARQDGYRIEVFRQHHDQVETLLTEFKNILIQFYPSDSTNEINGVLFDIFNCENDLASHNAVEDMLFIPTVGLLEQMMEEKR